ncbi:MAG: ChpI protein [Actinobacteria bacterium]|nr:ChpI protein [Actinomycetota bacterium]
MKTAVSLPDELFDDAERLADQLGLSRSELYARALSSFLETQEDDPVTAALDALADEVDGHDVSPAVGRALIDAHLWEW